MRVFADTEFTSFLSPRLISFGLVAEDGREFYCELSEGWERDHCTDFVLETVLPLLAGDPLMPCNAAGERLVEWLAAIDRNIFLVSDIETDWRLLSALINPHLKNQATVGWQRLRWPGHYLARRHEELLEAMLGSNPRRHHALVDARALRQVARQVEAEFRAG